MLGFLEKLSGRALLTQASRIYNKAVVVDVDVRGGVDI